MREHMYILILIIIIGTWESQLNGCVMKDDPWLEFY